MHRFTVGRRVLWALAGALVAALVTTAVASGQLGSSGLPIIGGKRNPSANTSQVFTNETEIIASNGTYGTRQSNKSVNGGGAIYGCRAKAGGTDKGSAACVRASNLSDGRAFEFNSDRGLEVGRITAGNPAAAPFTTNATGVATGLNADKVDGKDAEQIAADGAAAAKTAVDGRLSFASVDAAGKLTGGRGALSAATTGTGQYTVVLASDASACALTATQQTTTDAGAVGVQLQSDGKTVHVVTRAGGATNTDPADRPFQLTVVC